jgi:hypothetical protein
MPRYIFIVAVVGSILLSIATIYLTVLNRTPKIYGPALSILLGAVVTTFVTITILLKPAIISERFSISFVLDSKTKMPHVSEPADPISGRNFDTLAFTQNNVKLTTSQEIVNFYSELLQYALIKQCFIIFNADYGIGVSKTNTRSVVQPIIYSPLRPQYKKKIQCNAVAKLLAANRFVENYWRIEDPEICLPIPDGANLSFPNSQSIVIERPGYYIIVMSIKHIGGGAGMPEQVSKNVNSADVETTSFLINMEANFEKFTAESPYTIDAKTWTEALFTRLKNAMADQQS